MSQIQDELCSVQENTLKRSVEKESHQSTALSDRKYDNRETVTQNEKKEIDNERREPNIGDKTEETTLSPSEPNSAFNAESVILISDEEDDDDDAGTSHGQVPPKTSMARPRSGSLRSDENDKDDENVPRVSMKLASTALLSRDSNGNAGNENTHVIREELSSKKSGSSFLVEDENSGKTNKIHSEDKISSLKSTAYPSSSLQSFSDLSNPQSQSLPAHQRSEKFKHKSFTQYRESPASNKLDYKQWSKKGSDKSSSVNDEEGVEVQQAEMLLQNLNIAGEVKKEIHSKKDESPPQNIPEKTVTHDTKPSAYSTKQPDKETAQEYKESFLIVAKSLSSQSKAECKADGSREHHEDINQFESVGLLTRERNQYKAELAQLQTSIRVVRLDHLPDRGQRLLNKIKHLKEKISYLDERLSKSSLQTNVSCKAVNQNKSSGPEIVKVYPGQPGHKSIHVPEKAHQMVSKPSSLTSSNHTQAEPPHLMQQLYSANPQAMTLYGGRMTAQRLFQVGSITTEAITKLHKQLETCPDASEESSDPDGLRVTLMPHQRHALSWLDWREQQHPPCGILADDMGLGKTLTMISHVLKQKQNQEAASEEDSWIGKEKQLKKLNKAMKKSRATLIITPASLVHQWAKEIDNRCHNGLLKYLIYHGPNRETRIDRLIDQDIVITSYAIISREVGSDKNGNVERPVQEENQGSDAPESAEKKMGDLPLLLRIGWERVILDEAHEIKNHKSIKAQAVSQLRAAYRWALTGTPIQNDLKDMYSLLRFLRFSPFDEFKVWKKHIESAYGSTKRLNTIVKALLLRRTKGDFTSSGQPLIKLPSKNFHTITVELCPEERKIYGKLFRKTQSTVREYVHRHQDRTGNTSTSYYNAEYSGAVGGYDIGQPFSGVSFPASESIQSGKRGTGSQILVLLLRLRQCCCHLNLMKSHLESESLESDGIELTLEEQMKGLLLDDLLETKEPKDAFDVQQVSFLLEKTSQSTKLKCVMDQIKDIKMANPRDKCVIVSQWTSMLEIVGVHLKKEGISYSLIQGNIPAKKRTDIVDDFNRSSGDAQIMLVSLRAGGVGLNLIGGNHLFLLDCHWNPALEEQACDRIYRLGQEKDVSIYRFLCKDTIEEKISKLQQGKLGLAKSVLTGSATTAQKLSLDDLRLLFGV